MMLKMICRCPRLAMRALDRQRATPYREEYYRGAYASSNRGGRIGFYRGRYAWQRWYKDRAPGEASRRSRRTDGWLRYL